MLRRLAIAISAAAPFVLVACGRGDTKVDVNGSHLENGKLVRRDSSRTLGPGDIRISSQDSSFDLALIGDSIVAGLGTRVRNKVATDLDTTKVSGTGLGASIEKMVKGTVASALDHEFVFPIADVSDVRAQDGGLTFYDKDGKEMNVFRSDTKHDRSRAFSQADADAFVAAFKARKGRV
jgi:hypothetical protein